MIGTNDFPTDGFRQNSVVVLAMAPHYVAGRFVREHFVAVRYVREHFVVAVFSSVVSGTWVGWPDEAATVEPGAVDC